MNANVPTVIQAVEARAPAFAKVLPKSIKVDRFLAAAKTALLTVPGLDTCDVQSVVIACMRAAADGLVPDGRECVFVVGRSKQDNRWVNQCQYWTMVGGLLKIAFRSGMVLKLESRIVHAADVFSLEYGTTPNVQHTPALRDRGEVIGAYAIATLRSGHTVVEWMSADEIQGIMRRSKSYDREKSEARGPWASDFSEMARKTVLKRALKYLPTEASASRDQDSDAPAPEAELALGAVHAIHEGGITFTTLERAADRPVDEPEGVAEAEMLADVEIPNSNVTLWKGRLRELRDSLAESATKEEAEEAWGIWDSSYHPDAEVTARAKTLVDERLDVLTSPYARAKGG